MKLWNRFPAHLVLAPSVSIVKKTVEPSLVRNLPCSTCVTSVPIHWQFSQYCYLRLFMFSPKARSPPRVCGYYWPSWPFLPLINKYKYNKYTYLYISLVSTIWTPTLNSSPRNFFLRYQLIDPQLSNSIASTSFWGSEFSTLALLASRFCSGTETLCWIFLPICHDKRRSTAHHSSTFVSTILEPRLSKVRGSVFDPVSIVGLLRHGASLKEDQWPSLFVTLPSFSKSVA